MWCREGKGGREGEGVVVNVRMKKSCRRNALSRIYISCRLPRSSARTFWKHFFLFVSVGDCFDDVVFLFSPMYSLLFLFPPPPYPRIFDECMSVELQIRVFISLVKVYIYIICIVVDEEICVYLNCVTSLKKFLFFLKVKLISLKKKYHRRHKWISLWGTCLLFFCNVFDFVFCGRHVDILWLVKRNYAFNNWLVEEGHKVNINFYIRNVCLAGNCYCAIGLLRMTETLKKKTKQSRDEFVLKAFNGVVPCSRDLFFILNCQIIKYLP